MTNSYLKVITICTLALVHLTFNAIMATTAPAVDPALLTALQAKGTTATVIISFKSGTGDVLQNIEGQTYPSREAKTQAVHDNLKSRAEAVQKAVLEYLKSKAAGKPDLTYQTMWINNSLVVKKADLEVVEGLKNFEEIESVRADRIVAHIQEGQGPQ